MKNMTDLIEHLREENARLRAENEKFRERLIAFTGKDPR
jgi:regulator of replication initiation timing